jgi:hypothetical protein
VTSVTLAHKVLLAQPVLKDQQAHKEFKAQLEKLVPQAQQDRQEPLVHKDQLVQLEQPASL